VPHCFFDNNREDGDSYLVTVLYDLNSEKFDLIEMSIRNICSYPVLEKDLPKVLHRISEELGRRGLRDC